MKSHALRAALPDSPSQDPSLQDWPVLPGVLPLETHPQAPGDRGHVSPIATAGTRHAIMGYSGLPKGWELWGQGGKPRSSPAYATCLSPQGPLGMDRHSTADGGTQHDCKSSGAPSESEISPWMCCWASDRELPEGSGRPQVFKSSKSDPTWDVGTCPVGESKSCAWRWTGMKAREAASDRDRSFRC